MEGRQKPPKASHPFPDKVELWKLWDSPALKPFLKTSIVVIAGYTTFMYIWASLRDEGRGPLGCEMRSPEEIEAGLESSKVRLTTLNMPHLKPKEKPLALIQFDDRRNFTPQLESVTPKN